MTKALITLSILASALTGTQAGIILSDDFTYSDGPIAQPTASAINPSSTWIANTGSSAPMDVTNNTLIVTTSRTEDMVHTLAGYPYLTNGGTTALYSSYTLNCQGLPTLSGTYFSHFSGTNGFLNGAPNISGFRARVFASLTNYVAGTGVGTGQFNLGIVNCGYNSANISLSSTNYVWPTPLNTNTAYTIVTRYVLATGISTLWVNPTAESDPSVSDPNPLPIEPTSAAPTNGIMAIDGYSFRQATGEGTMYIDNLRVGTRFADVAGANQSPAISSIPNQAFPQNGNTGLIPFTVSDPETPADELIVTATSDNLVLVPNGSPNIVLTSDAGGTNRTITINPVAGQQGSANITVNVSDTLNDSFTTFKVTVGAPTIGTIPNQITAQSTTTPPIPFAVSDAEGDVVTLTVSSSNPILVPPGNVMLGVGVPNVSSNVVVTPAAGQSGLATITVSASDTHNTNTASFSVTVTPAALGVIYNENFAYTSFDTPNALYDATGGSGATWQHVSGPLYEIQVTNVTGASGFAYLIYTNNEDLGAGFIGSTTYDGSQGYVFYTSFTVDCSFLPSASGDYFFHLSASGTDTSAFRDKIFINTANAATGTFRLGIANTATSPIQFSRDLTVGVPYAVVSRYNAATGDSTLWVNPVNAQSPSVTASDSPQSSTIGGVALRQPGCCIGNLAIGPMKVGTSFSDVWTAPDRPMLQITSSGGNVSLSWADPPGLFVLQVASNVSGPYADIQGFTNPYTNPITGPQYFRLRY